MPFKKGNKFGNRFRTTNQPKKNGRKPSRVMQLISSSWVDDDYEQISNEDAMKLIRFLLSGTKSEIESLLRHPEAPLFIVTLIRAILTDYQNGRVDTINRLFDRVYGKAFKSIEVTKTSKSSLIPDRPMSRKDYESLLNDLI